MVSLALCPWRGPNQNRPGGNDFIGFQGQQFGIIEAWMNANRSSQTAAHAAFVHTGPVIKRIKVVTVIKS